MNRKTDKKDLICFCVIWAVLMAAAFYFCTRKQGFHEDEYYTYYSTARTNGFYVEDGKWMERETYRNEFVVLPGERFRYGLVKQVQSWDVHPPMYYWVFHTAASLVPGVFSKWIGLSVNLFFHGVNLILLTYLSYLAGGKQKKLAFSVTLFYGLTPAAMSGVVFIRMYEMLTTFVLMCAVLHVREIRRLQAAARQKALVTLSFAGFLLPMMLVTYIGFLTQYYYFIFLFYLAIAFCVYLLWRDRHIRNCLWYGGSQAAAFVLAYLTYPSCLGQMFRGQRGAQATANFFDRSNTFMRFRFFFDLLDEYVFGNLLAVCLLLLVGMALALSYKRSRERLKNAEGRKRNGEGETADGRILFAMLAFTAAGYFLTVAKTALLLGNTSNRYQLPIYGLLIFLVFWSINGLWQRLTAGRNERIDRFLPILVTAACVLIDVSGLCADRVAFLYPRAKEAVALAGEQAAAQIPVVYVYKPGEEWCVWAVADELMQYDRVYFVSAASEEPITEQTVSHADAIVAYLPLYEDEKDEAAQGMRIAASNPKFSGADLQYLHNYCSEWYYFSGETAASQSVGQ